MDAKELKKQLNIEHYRQIFTELGAEWKETNGEYWQLKSVEVPRSSRSFRRW